jgi:hypothetical protein
MDLTKAFFREDAKAKEGAAIHQQRLETVRAINQAEEKAVAQRIEKQKQARESAQ